MNTSVIQGAAVQIPAAGVLVDGDLQVPARATGLILFAQDSIGRIVIARSTTSTWRMSRREPRFAAP